MNEWQNMATAPRDGTEIIVCRNNGCGWEYYVVWWCDLDPIYPWTISGTVDAALAADRPDYWKPIGPPPYEPV